MILSYGLSQNTVVSPLMVFHCIHQPPPGWPPKLVYLCIEWTFSLHTAKFNINVSLLTTICSV